MKTAPQVSVIVAAYNLELYLERCLESLAQQSLAELEIVVVDDGSTDATPQVLAELAAGDPRVRLERQPNGGYGAAANRGVELSRAPWVMFVDGDDFVEPHVARTLLDAAVSTGAEVVMGNLRYRLPGGLTDVFKPLGGGSRVLDDDDRRALFEVSATPCARLYARRLFDEAEVRFPPGVLFADVGFSPQTYLAARRLAYLDRELYEYDQTRPTQSMKQTDRRVLGVAASMQYLLRYAKGHGHFEVWKAELLRYTLKHVLDWIPKVRAMVGLPRSSALRELFSVLDEHFGDGWTGEPLARLAGARRALLIRNARRIGYGPLAWAWELEHAARLLDHRVKLALGAPLSGYQRAKGLAKRRLSSAR